MKQRIKTKKNKTNKKRMETPNIKPPLKRSESNRETTKRSESNKETTKRSESMLKAPSDEEKDKKGKLVTFLVF